MNRRIFLKKSALATTLAGTAGFAAQSALAAGKPAKGTPEYYELREYTFKDEAQQQLTEDYWQKAAIPALNRLGSKPIGVFRETATDANPRKLHVVIPFKSMQEFSRLPEQLAKDTAYQQAGAAYLKAPAKNPAYERIQSSLLVAFTDIPKLEVPAATAQNTARIFELRRYESATEYAGKQKVKMFNSGGEIAIFRRTGLIPVFFGETLIGEKRPNLTYMVTFKDMEEHDRSWKTFVDDPEWKRVSALPEYADTVSNITRTFLAPLPFSQV
jgi:hypothetical protein